MANATRSVGTAIAELFAVMDASVDDALRDAPDRSGNGLPDAVDGPRHDGASHLELAMAHLEKATAELEPELLDAASARAALAGYGRIRRLVDFGIAALSRKVDDAAVVSRATGTPVGHAKATIELGRNLKAAPELGAALQSGRVSAEQAKEIASAEASVPGVVDDLVAMANSEPFQVFKDHARKLKLEAEQHKGLAAKQRTARSVRHYSDDLGMTHVHLAFEPLVGPRSSIAPRR